MQGPDPSNNAEAPDLLRRFIPTPFKARYYVGGIRIVVQTNDFTLLPAFSFNPAHDWAGEQNVEWTLIRDAESHGLLEPPLFLRSETLIVALLGTACVVALDHERRQLLGFIGADIEECAHQGTLVPLLWQMTNEVSVSDRSSRSTVGVKEFANG